MKEAFPDRVVYVLAVPRASSQDGGSYECSITHGGSGAVRAGGVAVTVFGESFMLGNRFPPSFPAKPRVSGTDLIFIYS